MSAERGERSAEKAACICEHGCRNCGNPLVRMDGCPAWDPCPIGRADDPACPVHHPSTSPGTTTPKAPQ